MTDIAYFLITGLISLIVGVVVGRVLWAKTNKAEEIKAKESAALILKEAELNAEKIKRDRILESKEKYLHLKSDFEQESNRKKNQLIANEQKLKQREQNLSRQYEQVKRKELELVEMKSNLSAQTEAINLKKDELVCYIPFLCYQLRFDNVTLPDGIIGPFLIEII